MLGSEGQRDSGKLASFLWGKVEWEEGKLGGRRIQCSGRAGIF